MKNLKENNLFYSIIKKAKKKEGVIVEVKVEGESEELEISLKIRRYNRGSNVFYFGLENKESNKSPKSMEDIFFRIFDGVNFKKEFKMNLICEDGYFKTWMYKGDHDERAVLEHFLNLKYYPRKWKIISILNQD